MNLIQATRKVKEKDKLRNKLIGQKELLMNGLADLGFKTEKEAEKASKVLETTVGKMKIHQTKGEARFMKDFAHLLT